MPSSCCVSGCSSWRGDQTRLSFHRVPGDAKTRRKWSRILGAKLPADGRKRVCSAHFNPACFVGGRLLRGAVPTGDGKAQFKDKGAARSVKRSSEKGSDRANDEAPVGSERTRKNDVDGSVVKAKVITISFSKSNTTSKCDEGQDQAAPQPVINLSFTKKASIEQADHGVDKGLDGPEHVAAEVSSEQEKVLLVEDEPNGNPNDPLAPDPDNSEEEEGFIDVEAVEEDDGDEEETLEMALEAPNAKRGETETWQRPVRGDVLRSGSVMVDPNKKHRANPVNNNAAASLGQDSYQVESEKTTNLKPEIEIALTFPEEPAVSAIGKKERDHPSPGEDLVPATCVQGVKEASQLKCVLCLKLFDDAESLTRHELTMHFAWALKPHDLRLLSRLLSAVAGAGTCKLKAELLAVVHEFETGYDSDRSCPECRFASRNRDALIQHYKLKHSGVATSDVHRHKAKRKEAVTRTEEAEDPPRDVSKRNTMPDDSNLRSPWCDDERAETDVGLIPGSTRQDSGMANVTSPSYSALAEEMGGGMTLEPTEETESNEQDAAPRKRMRVEESTTDRVTSQFRGCSDRVQQVPCQEPAFSDEKEASTHVAQNDAMIFEESSGECHAPENSGDKQIDLHVKDFENAPLAVHVGETVMRRKKQMKRGRSTYCNICHTEWFNPTALNDHTHQTHFPDLRCHLCGYQSSSWKGLKSHLAEKHDHDPNRLCDYRCEKCSKTFVTQRYLQKHLDRNCLKCYACDFVAKDPRRLIDHRVKAHNDKTDSSTFQTDSKSKRESATECGFCGKNFPNANLLGQHLHLEHYPDLKCPICCYEASDQLELSQHLSSCRAKLSSGVDKIECSSCGGRFASLPFLDEHLRVCALRSVKDEGKEKNCRPDHAGNESNTIELASMPYDPTNGKVKKMRCFHCPIDVCTVFSYHDELNRHLREKHYPRLRCLRCSYEGATMTNLKGHVMAEHRETLSGYKGKQCRYCKIVFFYQSSLTLHIRLKHEEIKTDKSDKSQLCGQCGEAFVSSKALARHTVVRHLKTYKCDKCESFATGCAAELESHAANWHTTICQDCGLPLDAAEQKEPGTTSSPSVGHDCPAQLGPAGATAATATATATDESAAGAPPPARAPAALDGDGGITSLGKGNGFECQRCGLRCLRKITVQRHVALMHVPQPCPLRKCGVVSSSRPLLRKHVRDGHPGVCADCVFVEGVSGGTHDCVERIFFYREDGVHGINPMLAALNAGVRPMGCVKCRRLLQSHSSLILHPCRTFV